MRNSPRCHLTSVVFLMALGGCKHNQQPSVEGAGPGGALPAAMRTPSGVPPARAASQARVVLIPLGGSGVHGTLELTPLPGGTGVKIEGELEGLPPGSLHGFHVHEIGDCASPDGLSAGDHFNPTQQPHGAPTASASHVGDLGNIQADPAGHAEVWIVKQDATLGTDPNSFIGRSVIVHEKRDDFQSQPAGDAGSRVACGVIRPL